MAERLTAEQAVARLRPDDSLGLPLGPGQPPAFVEALGGRDDWRDLKIYGSHLLVKSAAFSHPGVHYLSAFFSAIERELRDQGANVGFTPADFRRFEPLMRSKAPRVMATAATPPDASGRMSLSLHAGATTRELARAGADPSRLLLVETSTALPRTRGIPPNHPHSLRVDEVDILIESDRAPFELIEPAATEADAKIAAHAAELIPDGATIQTGIGSVPSRVASLLAEGGGGDYGIHTEVLTTGLMRLHRSGRVTNQKGHLNGLTATTFALGDRELYDWLDGNEEVVFLPVERINSREAIRANRRMVTVNAALAVDVHGQVVADTISGRQYSGIGGHEDFISGPALSLEQRALLCMRSTYTRDGELHSRIVPWFGAGAVITTPRHQVDVIVTEYGAAELQGKTVHQRGMALAAIAHPDFRDEIAAAAERASRGGSPLPG